jgi:signal transduction histidine kinase
MQRRTRWILAALFAAITAILSLTPVALWRTARENAIRSELAQKAVAQMEDVLHGEIVGERVKTPSWFVSLKENEVYDDPFVESDLLPPVKNWLRDAAGKPDFRDYPVEGADGFLAYVRPTSVETGYVTLVQVRERNEALNRLSSRFWSIVALIGGASLVLGYVVAGLALGPAKRAMGDQQGFLADAAHEMRTPLAVIMASSSQALARSRSSEEYVRSLSEIRSAAERASSGVNEMLDLVRLQTGQAIPRLGALRLDLLAEEICASVRPEGAEIIAEPSEAVVVDADMALLRQAVENLVRNAARRAQRVELLTRSEDRDGVLEVIDDGPGFDPAILPRVFERYQRGDRRGEAGMGLAIVKAIVSAHGGTAVAANRPEGGASVSIRIPLNRSVTPN